MGLTAVLTLRPSRQAADAVFAAVGLAVMAENLAQLEQGAFRCL